MARIARPWPTARAVTLQAEVETGAGCAYDQLQVIIEDPTARADIPRLLEALNLCRPPPTMMAKQKRRPSNPKVLGPAFRSVHRGDSTPVELFVGYALEFQSDPDLWSRRGSAVDSFTFVATSSF